MNVYEWMRRTHLTLALAVLAPLLVSLALLPLRDDIPNTDVALILVVVVVAVAASGRRAAGILAAVSAGIWFDFFFTEPYQRLTITDAADIETLVLLVVVGIAVTELSMWGHRQQALASREAGYLEGIRAAADAGATGGSTAELIKTVSKQLIEILRLHGCRYQAGVAGLGGPPRLRRDGQIVWHGAVWDVDRDGLPTEEIELLVENGGQLCGRFLLSAAPDTAAPLTERRLAVTLADQVGAAFR
jgi:hypothetical protein